MQIATKLAVFECLTVVTSGLGLAMGISSASTRTRGYMHNPGSFVGDELSFSEALEADLGTQRRSLLSVVESHEHSWAVGMLTRQEANLSRMADAERNKLLTCTMNEVPANTVQMYHTEKGVLCVQGNGYQTKATSTIAMIYEAVEFLKNNGSQSLPPFSMKTIGISDIDRECKSDFAYSIPWNAPSGCATRLIPDFTFWKWPEAHLLPDYASLTRKLNKISIKAPLSRKCGFAGSVGTKPRREEFVGLVKDFPNVDLILPHSTPGPMSMEKQAEEWACMIDLPGYGFSGRVPMLLHTGRPLVVLQRDDGHYVDRVWYSEWMVPGVNYIPMNLTASSASAAIDLALSDRGQAIGAKGLSMASQRLTTTAAIKGWADILAAIKS